MLAKTIISEHIATYCNKNSIHCNSYNNKIDHLLNFYNNSYTIKTTSMIAVEKQILQS